MGLAERRKAAQWQKDRFPDWKAQIDRAASFDVSVEVAWDQLAEDDYSHLYDEWFPKMYFQPLVRAFTEITVDDMGKEALRDRLTKVVIKNSGQHTGSRGFSFQDGVLTIDRRPCSYSDGDEERAQNLQKVLESAL